jgi:hypothetical protein
VDSIHRRERDKKALFGEGMELTNMPRAILAPMSKRVKEIRQLALDEVLSLPTADYSIAIDEAFPRKFAGRIVHERKRVVIPVE